MGRIGMEWMWHVQVGGLQSGRAYSFRVRARNERGQSSWSQEAPATTLPAPPDACSPPAFAARTASSVRVRWEPPLEDHGAAVTSYRCRAWPLQRFSFASVRPGVHGLGATTS